MALVISTAFITGCGASDEQTAKQCGVSVAALKQAKAAVETMPPFAGVDLGKCSVEKDGAKVEVVPPEAKHNADLMVAYQHVLEGIADRCGVSRSAWRVVDAQQVQLAPGPVSSDKVDCLMGGFHQAKLPVRIEYFGKAH